MTNPKKTYEDDDGRVICNMDVEGMRKQRQPFRQSIPEARPLHRGEMMTQSESRRFTWYAVLAGLSVAFVISAAWVIFILFCTLVWFR